METVAATQHQLSRAPQTRHGRRFPEDVGIVHRTQPRPTPWSSAWMCQPLGWSLMGAVQFAILSFPSNDLVEGTSWDTNNPLFGNHRHGGPCLRSLCIAGATNHSGPPCDAGATLIFLCRLLPARASLLVDGHHRAKRPKTLRDRAVVTWPFLLVADVMFEALLVWEG